jgi:hypothetical protein
MNNKLPTPDADFSADLLANAIGEYIAITGDMVLLKSSAVRAAYIEVMGQLESACGEKADWSSTDPELKRWADLNPEQRRGIIRNAMINAVRQWLPHDPCLGPYSRGK